MKKEEIYQKGGFKERPTVCRVVTLKEGDMYGLYYWEGDFYCIVIEDSIDVAFLDIDEETREEIAKEILAGNFKIDEHV